MREVTGQRGSKSVKRETTLKRKEKRMVKEPFGVRRSTCRHNILTRKASIMEDYDIIVSFSNLDLDNHIDIDEIMAIVDLDLSDTIEDMVSLCDNIEDMVSLCDIDNDFNDLGYLGDCEDIITTWNNEE